MKRRFVKLDAQNLSSFFPSDGRLAQQADETFIHFTSRLFFHFFQFSKLKIRSLEELFGLSNGKGIMFLNSIYSDGYTCQIMFARQRVADPFNNVKLQITDFSSDEIADHFRPCAVDPGRRGAFTSFHGNDDIRRLTTKEYYHASGSDRRMMLEGNRKRQAGIKEIENNIPTAKVTNDQHCLERIIYMQNNLNRLFDFYSFRVAKINWKNYRGG
ncbi:hypothetical protein RMATCC62417_14920 [Rhizopus microsporus]|nr:hypothetical protein RMATCC62417_14920 [Rhizopus microsporus]